MQLLKRKDSLARGTNLGKFSFHWKKIKEPVQQETGTGV
jgi:hypothetical protein